MDEWPQTLLRRDELAQLAYDLPTGGQHPDKRQSRRNGTARLLTWLETWPGATWQARWVASGAESYGKSWRDAAIDALVAAEGKTRLNARRHLTVGMSCVISLRVLRPGYDWLVTNHLSDTYRWVRALVDPEFFARIDSAAERNGVRERVRVDALNHLTRVVMHTGRGPRELTPDDLRECRAALLASGRAGDALSLAWEMLRSQNVFPAGTSTMRATLHRGQLTVEELVDTHKVTSEPVRALLIRYLRERSAGMDHVSLRALVSLLAGTFWKDIEEHHPGLDTIDLPPEVAAAWKERAGFQRRTSSKGKPRADRYSVFFAVRALYLDIAHWAVEDPSWARWVFRCPIRDEDVRGSMKHQRQRRARMHQRTRTLAPLLPDLVTSVERHLERMEKLLAATSAAPIGEEFSVNNVAFCRVQAAADSRKGNQRGACRVRVQRCDTGEHLDVERAEDEAFWTWAIVETLRHTGIRHEEMLELTHFALTTHILPDNGEVVPLLQIAPSKLDQERVLLVAPELAHVLARIVHRVRAGNEHIPLVSRYDPYERLTGAPLPHLFQRRHGSEIRVMSTAVTHRLLRNAIERAELLGPDGNPLRYTPHDFRRIFATEAVSNGLPVHIAAKLLGHNDLSTTQTYVAIYNDDVLRHHRSFITRRRALRPGGEYRDPTPEEWAEFEQHFTKRKVELGTCARPYGSPCRHEHACIRCPVLRPDPTQEPRLLAIVVNLNDRLREANERGWLGEVDGLKVSLDAASRKLAQMRRIRAQTTLVDLHPPTVRRQPHER
ncbi:site-specific integrase [Kibdelosporangium aridum]|uniref:tyrosine-type recombinase/integrase n=1 Tax=Kibdelosporangium aridum TaxID=2030 RepID=UPI00068C58D9|nr:site-specific integrase [Kibdelosporangium aridum]